MNKNTRAVMTFMKNVFENVVAVRSYQAGSETRTYYLEIFSAFSCFFMELRG